MIASSVTLLEERRERMLFSRPYMIAAQYLVVPRGSNATTLEDLARQQVGAQIGTTGAQIAGDAGATVRTYDDLGLAVEDLYRRRLAGIVADVAIVEYYILNHPRYGAALHVVETPYAQENYAFAFALNQGSLRDRVDRALEDMIADGTVQRLKEFWFRRIIPPTP
jgi:polar amino acid transport system substrate-binding protein